MSFARRATLTVACAAAAAALATTSTAAELPPSGGASLSAGAPPSQPAPATPATPLVGTVPTGAAPLTGSPARSRTATLAPALPVPVHRQFSGSTGPSGGVALFPIAHIAPHLVAAPAHAHGHSAAWTVRLAGRRVTFAALAAPSR
ncbi:MAG TPA: hypothetical protein VG410_15190 [Solirubrobacteraceae bacterium]|nr:hypothetical protein [Solirubrobacteraceae bacterium]